MGIVLIQNAIESAAVPAAYMPKSMGSISTWTAINHRPPYKHDHLLVPSCLLFLGSYLFELVSIIWAGDWLVVVVLLFQTTNVCFSQKKRNKKRVLHCCFVNSIPIYMVAVCMSDSHCNVVAFSFLIWITSQACCCLSSCGWYGRSSPCRQVVSMGGGKGWAGPHLQIGEKRPF
jgi:hypothetical protein